MLFVAKYRGYSFTARHTVGRDRHLETGEPLQRGIQCDFRPSGIPIWAQEHVLEAFGRIPGLGHDEEPFWRMSMYDTDAEAAMRSWSPEDKKHVETRLLESPSRGVEYVLVERPKRPAPWPAYDRLVARGRRTNEMVAAEIAETVARLEYEVGQVIAYERENANRREVVGALEALPPQEPVEDDEIMVSA